MPSVPRPASLARTVATYTPSMQDPEQPKAATLHLRTRITLPCTNDVEPFEPTIVERGDDSYYKPPFN